MRKKILAFAFAAALVVAMAVPMFGAGTASADGLVNVGQPNCIGQTAAANAIFHLGIEQATVDHGFASVQEALAFVRDNC